MDTRRSAGFACVIGLLASALAGCSGTDDVTIEEDQPVTSAAQGVPNGVEGPQTAQGSTTTPNNESSTTTPDKKDDKKEDPKPDGTKPAPMTFFITSAATGDRGGNLGGLAGADKLCQDLATAAGAGQRTWHAYLSTSGFSANGAVNARDRIGKGPWANQKGKVVASSVADLHSRELRAEDVFDEKGGALPNVPHNDVFTGSTRDGTSTINTCGNWGLNVVGNANVGHADATANKGGDRWNNSHTVSCDTKTVRLYCFAIN